MLLSGVFGKIKADKVVNFIYCQLVSFKEGGRLLVKN